MRDARAVLDQVGLDIAPSTRIRSLSLAQRQLVEIGRALSRRARVIVLDEPTATLTSHEVRILVATVARLKKTGVGIIFISHHLEEVFEICDRVTVMRDGYTVETRAVQDWIGGDAGARDGQQTDQQFFPEAGYQARPLVAGG